MAHSDEIKQSIENIRNMPDADLETQAILSIVETLNEINWTQTYIKKNLENLGKAIKYADKDCDTGPSNYY